MLLVATFEVSVDLFRPSENIISDLYIQARNICKLYILK